MENFSYTSPLLDDGNYDIFVKPDLYPLTEREFRRQKEFCDVVNYWRANPVACLEDVLGASLLDYQAYCLSRMWTAQQSVLTFSRNGGKSTLIALYCMDRCMLVPGTQVYIASSSGGQSIETFNKIVQLTKRAIPSFTSLTDCFDNELQKAHGGDGFVRDPSSYHFTLYNGSSVHTVNSNLDGMRGKRANVVIFDESGVIPDKAFAVLEPFAAQNSSFQLSVDNDELEKATVPLPFPNQLIYASSASTTDSYFYKKYKEASIKSWAGDTRYFCADINADVIINATKGGIKLAQPLLTQEHIDSAMQRDKAAAMREYMNVFSTEGGEQAIVKRSQIIKNSYPYLPELFNRDNKSFYGIAYDPARQADNSTVLVARYWEDPVIGWKMRIVNCIVLRDRMSKKGRMLNTPEQVEELKQIIIDYNGEDVADYENILTVNVDSGSGGAGVNITDFLAEDWIIAGRKHKGLIDPEFNEGFDRKFPNANSNVLHLISPSKYKAQMYEEVIQMVSQDVVEFPEEYMGRGYIDILFEVDKDGNETQRFTFPDEKEEKALKKKGIEVIIRRRELDTYEEEALTQIDALKTELVNMWRFKTTAGNSRFELAPDKVSYLHDDRAYCFALLSSKLSDLRRSHITNRRTTTSQDLVDMLPMRQAKINRMIG